MLAARAPLTYVGGTDEYRLPSHWRSNHARGHTLLAPTDTVRWGTHTLQYDTVSCSIVASGVPRGPRTLVLAVAHTVLGSTSSTVGQDAHRSL